MQRQDPTRQLLYREQKIPLWFWIGISTVMIMSAVILFPMFSDSVNQMLERRQSNLAPVTETQPAAAAEQPITAPQPTAYAPRPTPLPLIAAVPPTSPPPATATPVTEPTVTAVAVAVMPTETVSQEKEWVASVEALPYEAAPVNGVCPAGYVMEYSDSCVNLYKAPDMTYDRGRLCEDRSMMFLISIQACTVVRPERVNPDDLENPVWICPEEYALDWKAYEDFKIQYGVDMPIGSFPCLYVGEEE